MDPEIETIRAELENGAIIRIEATPLQGEVQIADTDLIAPFVEVTNAVEGIAQSMLTTLKKIKPKRGSLEFGLQIGVEAGKLTALLVKGTGAANLKIILEWGELDDSTGS